MDIILAKVTFYFTLFVISATIVGIFSGGNTFTRYIALAFDIFWNVLTGGHLGITISSRAGIAASEGRKWGIWLSGLLSKFDENHCQKAIQNDIDRAWEVIKELSPYDSRNENK